MNATIPPLCLFALLPRGAAVEHAPTPQAAAEVRAENFDELLDAYELAHDDYQVRLRAAKGDARRELRAHHPAVAFWERFEAAAQAGEGRALAWMLTHLRDKGLRTNAVREAAPPLYQELFARHAGAPWFGEVLTALRGERRIFEAAQHVAFYERTLELNETPAVRAQAMFQLGQLLNEAEDDEQQATGKRWLQRVGEEFGETAYGVRALAELHPPVIGRPAPDFVGQTIEGDRFKLSDYRGKVVLLDFYGFW